MAFPNTPSDLDTTVVNGITYQYSAAKSAWIRLQVGISDLTLSGNVTANKVYTTQIRWAGNNAIFNAGITYTASTSPAAAKVGDQWYNTATDILYEYITDGTAAYWVDIQSLGMTSANAVAKSLDDLTMSGNIILTSNLVYSLAGDTGRLRSIFAGNVIAVTGNINTINTGNIAGANVILTGNVTAGDYLFANGVNILSTVSTYSNTTAAAYLTTATITTTGNLQGSYMLGDGSKLTNLPSTGTTTGKAIAMSIVFGG